MLRALTWTADGSHSELPPEQLPAALAGDGFLWVDITGPDDAEAALLQDVFHFHPLAIEDTRNQRQRPKVEEYAGHLFLILNPGLVRDAECHFRELDAFVGRNFVVTVHPDEEPVLVDAARRAERMFPGQINPATFLYVLLDTVVDSYFPMLDELADAIEEIEDLILDKPRQPVLERLFQLKRQLVMIRKVVAPQRDTIGVLYRRDLPYLDLGKLGYHVRDVHDHLLRISDMIDTFRELLSGAIDLYMSAVSNRLNRVVHRLTVVTMTVGVMAVITGFYGMNFQRTWPPFEAWWGAPFTLALMAVTVAVIGLLLRSLRLRAR